MIQGSINSSKRGCFAAENGLATVTPFHVKPG